MKKILSVVTFCSLFSVAAFAENYSGKLIDAGCYSQQKKTTGCDPSSSTTAFALEVSGKVLVLDPAGNSMALKAMSSRADRAADPANPDSKAVMAKVSGTEKGGTITVDSVDIP
jgi:hypothetical protein